MHKFYASGTILYRGSTLLAVLIVQPLILMITESPDRIRVTQSWSSHKFHQNAPTKCTSLCDFYLCYSSLQRFIRC